MGAQRVQVESFFIGPPSLAFSIPSVIEEKNRKIPLVQEAQIIEPIDNVPRITVTPDDDGAIGPGLDVPPEELGSVGCLKPDVLKRKSARGAPVFVMPALRMKDEELVEDVPGQHS
jgi:hypothetical protein